MRVAVLGAGAGGAAAAVELIGCGHSVALWNRSQDALDAFRASGGIHFEGVLGAGVARPATIAATLAEAIVDAEMVLVALPTIAHASVAGDLAAAGWPEDRPIVLNPAHTGGVLEFDAVFRSRRGAAPLVAGFSTLTYVARRHTPEGVTITGKAKHVRVGALPGQEAAIEAAMALFPAAVPAPDVLACDLANVNMVLHPPGAVLAAAWIEARAGDFTFYVDGMTPGVARTMRLLDEERRHVARAFGHDLPNLIGEMRLIGTVSDGVRDDEAFDVAIAAGEANRQIRAPDSLRHRYYREDFGHGLLPFIDLARIASVDTPVARSLLVIAQAMIATDFREGGRTADTMGIGGFDMADLIGKVRAI